MDGGLFEENTGYGLHFYTGRWLHEWREVARENPNGCGIVNNVVRNVRLPWRGEGLGGLIMRYGKDALVYNNIVENHAGRWHVLNNTDAQVYNNTFYNNNRLAGAAPQLHRR